MCVCVLLPRAYNPRGLLEVRQALESVSKVEDLLPIMKVGRGRGERERGGGWEELGWKGGWKGG